MDDLPATPGNDTVPAKLREAIDTCLNAGYKPGSPPPIPASFKIDNPRDAVKDAFQLVGGVPRLAHWADKNFDRFVMGPLSKIITAQPGASKDEPIHVIIGFDLGNRFGRIVEGTAVAEVVTQAHHEPQLVGESAGSLLAEKRASAESAGSDAIQQSAVAK